jgi:cytochrome oxidase Cu insertion factor (SCO1/SenC/PrrC family)
VKLNPPKLSPQLTLLLLAVVCALPVAASYLAFYLWPPGKQMNYGELVGPTPVPEGAVTPIAGIPFDQASLKGHWVMVYAGPAACDAACRESLYFMRQVRTAQGKEMERVERLWLITDQGQPSAEALEGQPGLTVARTDPAWLARLGGEGTGPGRIHLIDPLGLVMLRYPAGLEPKRMIKDLERLLKYSRVG